MDHTIVPPLNGARMEQQSVSDWEIEIKEIEKDVNATISKSTGSEPFESVYGYLPRYKEDSTRVLKLHA